jgi:hypothetical protein
MSTNPTSASCKTLIRRKAMKFVKWTWCIASVLLAAVGATAQEAPPPGSIELLPGFHHHLKQGIDSATGTIGRKGGLQIEYDIGEQAGDYTQCAWCGWTKGEVWRKKQVISGQEVICVFTNHRRLVVSFPEVHANFYATIRTNAELAEMLLMVFTFRAVTPKGPER